MSYIKLFDLSLSKLPNCSYRIFLNCLIRRENDQPVYKRLAHDHPVKWIFMIIRQLGQVERGFFVEWKAFDFMQLPLVGNDFIRWFRKR